MGEEAARIFDEIIIRHDEDMRGRTYEELDRLLTAGIRRVSADIPITYFGTECEAVEKALQLRKPKSLIVVLIENVQAVTDCIMRYHKMTDAEAVSIRRAV
jgi:cyanophycin synthetase